MADRAGLNPNVRGSLDSLVAAIDDESPPALKTHERQTKLARELRADAHVDSDSRSFVLPSSERERLL